MAEFLASKIDKQPIATYGINSFVAKMLYTTDSRIVIPFFCANNQKFLEMFSKIDILNILNNLAIFHYNNFFGNDIEPVYEEQQQEPVYEQQQQEPVYEEQTQPPIYQNIKRNNWRSMLSNR